MSGCYIEDRWLVVFARRKYGDAFARHCARYFVFGRGSMADHLRRSLTAQMRRASS